MSASKAWDQPVVKRIGAGADRLQPSRSVHVCHRRDLRAPFLANLVDLHHERHLVVGLEPVRDGLAQHRRRERPKGLAPLDLRIQDVFHVRTPRVADDAAVAERAWSPFHAPLEPANHLPFRDRRRRPAAQRRRIGNAVDVAALLRQIRVPGVYCRLDAGSVEVRPPIGVVHGICAAVGSACLARQVTPRDARGAEGAAGVAGRRLHVERRERRVAVDLAVGDGVHRASARQRQCAKLVALVQRVQQVEERLFVHRLGRSGDVTMVRGELFAGLPRRPEHLGQAW